MLWSMGAVFLLRILSQLCLDLLLDDFYGDENAILGT
jgi:hypothetical protein